jgi:DNA-directed RNA polymerase specialized sigma24 family protein
MTRATGETDAAVIARSIKEPEQFEAVFERHLATVHRYLRRRVGGELAQELAAETFVQAFRARPAAG